MAKQIKCPNPDCECTIELVADENKNLIATMIKIEKPDDDEEPETEVEPDEDDIFADIIGGFDDDDE